MELILRIRVELKVDVKSVILKKKIYDQIW